MMKYKQKISSVLVLFLIFSTVKAQTSGLKCQFMDPLVKVFPETPILYSRADTIPIMYVAKGENASFQLALRSIDKAKEVNITAADLTVGQGKTVKPMIGYIDYVKVGRTYPNQAIDRLVSPSGYYPDPIITNKALQLEPGITRSFWLGFSIPVDAQPGQYSVSFKVKAGADTFVKKAVIQVYDVAVKPSNLMVTNWYSLKPERLQLMNGGQKVIPYSDNYWNLVRVIAKMMAGHGQNVALISPLDLALYTKEDNGLKIDFSRFDRTVSIFDSAGVSARIEGGHIGQREGLWDSKFIVNVPQVNGKKTTFVKLPIENEAATDFYRKFFKQLSQHLKTKGWYKRYYQHIADEPIESNADSYIKIANFVKTVVPDIKIIEACHTKDVANMIDVWVPELDFLSKDYKFYQQRQQKGDQLWFYTCLAPKGNFANRFLDLPLIKTRLLHWINFKYGITGYLHWGFNMWNQHPFEETTGINMESGNVLPGGDSWIVYPGDHQLYSSIRLETMLDGINDYALLKMLDKKNHTLATRIINSIVFRFDWYDANIANIREKHRQILAALTEN